MTTETTGAGDHPLEGSMSKPKEQLASWSTMPDWEICERAYFSKEAEMDDAIDELKKRGYTAEQAFYDIMSAWW